MKARLITDFKSVAEDGREFPYTLSTVAGRLEEP